MIQCKSSINKKYQGIQSFKVESSSAKYGTKENVKEFDVALLN